MTYPCADCIVKLQCVNYCDKIVPDGEDLYIDFVTYKKCPDCGHNMFNKIYDKFLIKVKCLGCEREFYFSKNMGWEIPIIIVMKRSKEPRNKVDPREYYGTEIIDWLQSYYSEAI